MDVFGIHCCPISIICSYFQNRSQGWARTDVVGVVHGMHQHASFQTESLFDTTLISPKNIMSSAMLEAGTIEGMKPRSEKGEPTSTGALTCGRFSASNSRAAWIVESVSEVVCWEPGERGTTHGIRSAFCIDLGVTGDVGDVGRLTENDRPGWDGNEILERGTGYRRGTWGIEWTVEE